jgi:hypothetical protein
MKESTAPLEGGLGLYRVLPSLITTFSGSSISALYCVRSSPLIIDSKVQVTKQNKIGMKNVFSNGI